MNQLSLSRNDSDVFAPDGVAMPEALARTTHLCVGAHQDDQEFMAYHGIAECFGNPDQWFAGVIVTNGGGSARMGPYADYSDEQMMAVRRREQQKAAMIGDYGCQIQLAYPSSAVKQPGSPDVIADLAAIMKLASPRVLYLHNPSDKHDTHVACALHALAALRQLPPELRPEKVLGCEIWRGLDWLCDADKQVMDVAAHPNLAASLSGVFDSQITGGKRYDLAVAGRRMANATFFESHAVDATTALAWAMDLTPLVNDPNLDICEFSCSYIDRMRDEVASRIAKLEGK